ILVARPLAVFLSLLFFRGKRRGKMFIAWVGLRGAVPIVFATYPMLAGIDKAQTIFNIVFFVSLTSVLIQGTTIPRVARRLRLLLPVRVKRMTHADFELTDSIKSEFVEIELSRESAAVGKQIVDLGFPKTALISLIRRNGKFISPNGATVLEASDILWVIAETRASMKEAYAALNISYPED
ncbi:MAG: cation:proton antiporter, partial [Acidobacteria bacterium]|nr:cation:proton antiporter [Acidobacteriota bacterium]